MIEHDASAIPEDTVVESIPKMHALRALVEPLIGFAAEGETLARMIERVTRRDAVMRDLRGELDRLYVEKS